MHLLKNLEVVEITAFINAQNFMSAMRSSCMRHFWVFTPGLGMDHFKRSKSSEVLFPKAVHSIPRLSSVAVFDRMAFLCNYSGVHQLLLLIYQEKAIKVKQKLGEVLSVLLHTCNYKAVANIFQSLPYQLDIKGNACAF